MEPAITIPQGATSVTIGSDGTVSATLVGQPAAQQVGNIQLALFPNPGGLNSVGKNLFSPPLRPAIPYSALRVEPMVWDRFNRDISSSRTSA